MACRTGDFTRRRSLLLIDLCEGPFANVGHIFVGIAERQGPIGKPQRVVRFVQQMRDQREHLEVFGVVRHQIVGALKVRQRVIVLPEFVQ